MGESSANALRLARTLGKLSSVLGTVLLRLPHLPAAPEAAGSCRPWCPRVGPALLRKFSLDLTQSVRPWKWNQPVTGFSGSLVSSSSWKGSRRTQARLCALHSAPGPFQNPGLAPTSESSHRRPLVPALQLTSQP